MIAQLQRATYLRSKLYVLLRIFRNNSPFTVLILFLIVLLVRVKALIHPQVPLPVAGYFMYNYVLKGLNLLFAESRFAWTMMALVSIFLQALYIKNITSRHKLFPRYTYIPAYVYIILTSIDAEFGYFGVTVIINWFLLGAMDLMFSFTQTTQPRKSLYNAGFLLAMAAIFQFSMLSFFLLLLVGMVMFRPFNLGEWSVALMGYLTPLYFLVSCLFLTDRLYLINYWPHVGISLPDHISSPFHLIITISGLLILSGAGTFAMRQNVPLTNIYVRRDWTAVSYYLFISMLVAFITDETVKTAWLIIMPALSIIISHAFLLEKNKWFSNFIFYFSLIFLMYSIWKG